MKRSKLLALFGAAALTLGVFGVALATEASTQGIVPTLHDSANITLDGNGNNDKADCANIGTEEDPIWDGIETGDSGGSGDSPSGVSVTWTYDAGTKAFGFTATGGVVLKAYVKGGNAYNEYDYTGLGGVTSDSNMYAPDNGSEGPAGLSHAVFCTGPGEEESEAPSEAPSFEASQEAETSQPSFSGGQNDLTDPPTDTIGSNGTSAPADGAWLLVVALGVLLASVVVLTPAKANGRR